LIVHLSISAGWAPTGYLTQGRDTAINQDAHHRRRDRIPELLDFLPARASHDIFAWECHCGLDLVWLQHPETAILDAWFFRRGCHQRVTLQGRHCRYWLAHRLKCTIVVVGHEPR